MGHRILSLTALALVAVLARTGSAQDVGFRLARGHLIVVPVTIDGEGPFDFLVDTGATMSLVDSKLARELELKPLQETVIRTASGSERAPIARVRRIDVGERSAETVLVLCAELSGLRSLDDDVRGILGFNFLSRFSYTLDYDSRRLRFEDRNGRAEARIPFESDARAIVLSTERLRWTLDTGATGVFLFAERLQGLEIERSHRAIRAVTTGSGRRVSRSGVLRRLTLGGESFERVPVTIVPGRGLDHRADGLLPGSLFHAIHIDHRNEYVILNPELGTAASRRP